MGRVLSQRLQSTFRDPSQYLQSSYTYFFNHFKSFPQVFPQVLRSLAITDAENGVSPLGEPLILLCRKVLLCRHIIQRIEVKKRR